MSKFLKLSDNFIQTEPISVFPLVTYPGLEITGGSIYDLVTNGQAQALCIEKIANRYNSAACAMVMDLSVEAEAFGASVHFSNDDIPTVQSKLISDLSEISNIKIPAVGEARTGEYLKAAEIAATRISNKPVFGGMIGPYSLAGRLLDITEIMTLILLEPDRIHELLNKITSFLIDYAREYKKRGTAGIIIAEPAAGLLYPEACTEFSSLYVKKIVDAVQDDSFMVVLHNCGNTLPLLSSMLLSGSKAYHFGNSVDMAEVLPQMPHDVLVMGNIDPVSVFKNGTPDEIITETQKLIELGKTYKNLVISSGCDIPPGTMLKNIDVFFHKALV